MVVKIAFRNILRNRRRSFLTMLAIVVGAMAVVLFGEYVAFVKAGLETSAVRSGGHLTIFREGYIDYGAGNPGAFAIQDYDMVMRSIQADPSLADAFTVITPTISVMGIAGNFDIDASKTFLGLGVVPSAHERMARWDEHQVRRNRPVTESGLRDDDETRGVIGVGLARVLGLCESLKLPHCPPRPVQPSADAEGASMPDDIAALAANERPQTPQVVGQPHIDLLAATAGGAPNVVTLMVDRTEGQPARELDDSFVAMHFNLAQRLLFGKNGSKAVGLVMQLHRTGDIRRVRARLTELFKEKGLALEVRDFAELQPFYVQATGMFGAIAAFISLIILLIVLFTVVNTVGMSVMERTSEIGTSRALGVRRGGVRRLFVIEGALLGMIGATVGVVAAQLVAVLFNRAGLTWTPPGQSSPVPLEVMTSGVSALLLRVWFGLVIAATIAAVIPANRAARLAVVDALRRV